MVLNMDLFVYFISKLKMNIKSYHNNPFLYKAQENKPYFHYR